MNIHLPEPSYTLNPALITILNNEMQKSRSRSNDNGHIIFNFRDPQYTPEQGGFHPVEIMLNASGKITYMTL